MKSTKWLQNDNVLLAICIMAVSKQTPTLNLTDGVNKNKHELLTIISSLYEALSSFVENCDFYRVIYRASLLHCNMPRNHN